MGGTDYFDKVYVSLYELKPNIVAKNLGLEKFLGARGGPTRITMLNGHNIILIPNASSLYL